MLKKKNNLIKSLAVSTLLLLGGGLIAQQKGNTNALEVPDHRTCGTMENFEYLKQTRPGYADDVKEYNKILDQWIESNRSSLNTNSVITIPVVIHVVYKTAAENITDAQAISQFSVLNNDFQRHNSDTALGASFYSAAGGVNFQFCLA